MSSKTDRPRAQQRSAVRSRPRRQNRSSQTLLAVVPPHPAQAPQQTHSAASRPLGLGSPEASIENDQRRAELSFLMASRYCAPPRNCTEAVTRSPGSTVFFVENG